jgi:hypothetical protein
MIAVGPLEDIFQRPDAILPGVGRPSKYADGWHAVGLLSEDVPTAAMP